MIELIDTGTDWWKTYSIAINGNRYDLITTIVYTLDTIGEFFANYISSVDPTVDGRHNPDSNILSIQSIIPVPSIAASTGIPSPTIAVVIPKDNPEVNLEY